MKIVEAGEAFDAYFKGRKENLSRVDATSALSIMSEFYRTVRCEEVDLENQGDMLLLQWGNHDWGKGKRFEFGVTRQFLINPDLAGEEEDVSEGIWQLHLTLRYPISPELEGIREGNCWCESPGSIRDLAMLYGQDLKPRLSGVVPEDLEIRFEMA